MDGTVWKTHGNYGSRLFDDLHNHLEIAICDNCLDMGAKRGRVTIVEDPRPVRPPEPERTRWTGRLSDEISDAMGEAWVEELKRNPPF